MKARKTYRRVERDWAVALLFTFLGAIMIVGMNVYFYMQLFAAI